MLYTHNSLTNLHAQRALLSTIFCLKTSRHTLRASQNLILGAYSSQYCDSATMKELFKRISITPSVSKITSKVTGFDSNNDWSDLRPCSGTASPVELVLVNGYHLTRVTRLEDFHRVSAASAKQMNFAADKLSPGTTILVPCRPSVRGTRNIQASTFPMNLQGCEGTCIFPYYYIAR